MLVHPLHSGHIAGVSSGTLSSGVWRERAAECVVHTVCTGRHDSHMSQYDPGSLRNTE